MLKSICILRRSVSYAFRTIYSCGSTINMWTTAISMYRRDLITYVENDVKLQTLTHTKMTTQNPLQSTCHIIILTNFYNMNMQSPSQVQTQWIHAIFPTRVKYKNDI